MPGLVGLVGRMSPEARDKLLQNMVQSLKDEDWYQVHLYTDDEVGLGRVSLGILNPEPQPIWNEDRSLCIVMEGEVYGYEHEKQRLIERGHHFQVGNDAEYVLHLYEEYGDDFAPKLNGAFVAAIWNPQARRLLIVNDHMGTRPLYYAQHDGRLLFGAGARTVVADPSFERKVNTAAVIEMLSFDQLWGDHTLFEDVNLLPAASIMVYQDGRLCIEPYWELQFPQTYEYHDEDYYYERWSALMRQAVARQTCESEPGAVLLSGGLDSRNILAMMDHKRLPVQAFSLGQPDCDDVRLAREVAASLKVEHRFFPLQPDYLMHLAEEGVRLTDGMKNCMRMAVLGPLRDMAKQTRVFYKGLWGDTMHGLEVTPELLAPFEESTMARMLFHQRNSPFREEEHAQLFTEPFYRKVRGQAFESFLATRKRSHSTWAVDVNNHIGLQVDRRNPTMGAEIVRNQAAVRTPLADKDFVEFVLTLPPGLRQDRTFYFSAFSRAFPELAKIPYEGTGLPLVECFRELRIRADRQIRWRLRAAGLKWVPEQKHKPFTDYDGWLRTVLRPWAESILLDRRTLDRGYFRPETIRSLVEQHMQGQANYSGKLGALITLELWHRQFID